MEQKKVNSHEGFTLSLALVDALPVLFFGISCILIGLLYKSPLFIIGACFAFLGGLGKVLWKIFLATSKKDILFLNKQFRYTMSLGFLLILLSLIVGFKTINFGNLWHCVISWPSVIFFLLGLSGMVTMGVLAKKLDSTQAKNNWIEQCVNAFAQLCIMLGILFLF